MTGIKNIRERYAAEIEQVHRTVDETPSWRLVKLYMLLRQIRSLRRKMVADFANQGVR